MNIASVNINFSNIRSNFFQIDVLYLLFIALIFILFSSFNIHGSSVGMLSNYYGYENDSDLLLFTPRYIRSDEWLGVVSERVSSSILDESLIVDSIGMGQKTSAVYDVPVRHWRQLFSIPTLPFHIFSTTTAFSASWWLASYLLILSSYLFLSLFTKNKILAIFGSLIFYFSPFLLWWNISHLVAYVLFSFYFFVKFSSLYIDGLKLKATVYLAFALYFAFAFAISLYPPFQIPLIYTLAILFIGIHFSKYKLMHLTTPLAGLFFIIITLIFGLSSYYLSFRQEIEATMNTSYPGERFETGGGINATRLISGFYDLQLQDDIKITNFHTNQSETSSFMFFFLPILAVMMSSEIYKIINRKKVDFVAVSLILSTLLIFGYIFIGFPSVISRFTFFYLVTSKRAFIALGVINISSIIYYLSSYRSGKYPRYVGVLISIFLFLSVLFYGFWLKDKYPFYIQSDLKIILISLFAGISSVLLLFQKSKLFISSFLLFSIISTYRIQPVYKGLDILLNSDLANKVNEIDISENNNSIWIVYDSNVYSSVIQANGVQSLGGIHMYPQYEMWKYFDDDGSDKEIWNRYANVAFQYSPNIDEVFISSPQADAVLIKINPCHPVLKELGVSHIVSGNQLSDRCLNYLSSTTDPNALNIYEIN